ncbi:acyltransferase [Pseudoalteromonas sp. PA2MD11]|uniref:acyltransferase n=1 Tax=Pseudoalteromonas sp. PA2MD11 TaxID=2785057 RepID=UPI001AE06CB1|nr:acyltransferase [Pseudoalteromonas sp. PA2MD11]
MFDIIKFNLICFKRNPLLLVFNYLVSFLSGFFCIYSLKNYTTTIRNPKGIQGGDKVFYKSLFSSPGIYINAINGIQVGRNLLLGPDVGLISSAHKIEKGYPPKDGIAGITIGDDCWVGMGAKILPSVILGDNTVVAAGSVVTKSFPEGNCILAGSPAKIIKQLNKN